MDFDPSSSEQVNAAAQQAEANFETLQQFSRQLESLLPSPSSTAASPGLEDIDYRSVCPEATLQLVEMVQLTGRTWDEMSTCSAECEAEQDGMGTGEQDEGDGIEVDGTNEEDDVMSRLLAAIERSRAPRHKRPLP